MVERKRSFSPIRTKYPGVYVILGTDPLGDPQRIFYVSYRRAGKQHFEKIGREGDRTEDGDKITEAVAAGIRSDKIKGRVLPNRERREAERAEKKAIAERWTFDKLWNEYQAGKPEAKRSATDETNFTKHLSPTFGDKEPREIVPLDVDRLRMKLSKKLKAGTVKNVLELLRRLSNFAANKRLCDPLPFRVTMPKVNNLKTEDLNAGQMARLLGILHDGTVTEKDGTKTTLDPDAREIMLMAIYTGMRRGEIFRLTWEDVDFRRGFITLREPKGGTDQTIPLPEEARELLEHRPRRKDCPYIFPGRVIRKKDGSKEYRPKADASKNLRAIREAAKLPKDFRPMHGLRHVFASMLASSGEVDLYTLQRLLTHKSPTMTQRYAHLTDAALKRGSDVMSRIVKEAKETAGGA